MVVFSSVDAMPQMAITGMPKIDNPFPDLCIILLYKHFQGTWVAQLVEHWTCDWKVAGSNSGLIGPCGAISIFSAFCVVPFFR